jgi:4-hydroxybenzoate polyprenyltransferase
LLPAATLNLSASIGLRAFYAGKRIDLARINGASTEKIKGFFKLLQLPAVQAIAPEHRYNMDETGLMEGQGDNGLVVGASQEKTTLKKQPGSRSWTTIIECISATGGALVPLVIFKGRSVQQQWFSKDLGFLNRWHLTASEKGWTDDSIALEWLRKVFIPQTAPPTATRPQAKRLLIVDGHGSHETIDFLYECFQNDIYKRFPSSIRIACPTAS